MSLLQIGYREDHPYDGWVELRLAGDFSGNAGFSGEPAAFSAFARALAIYPLSKTDPVRFDDGEVSIALVPADSVGHLRLTVELGEPGGWGSYLRVAFPTNYAWIAVFREALTNFIQKPDQGLEIEIG
jgi:hypothetical protein